MSHTSAQLLAILLLIALIAVAGPHLRRLGTVARLNAELQRRLPVFSAETTRGNEAEFIRDRLPRRVPFVLLAALLVLFVAAAWWLSR